MGTWSADILGNDTSAQTYESFMTSYDAGKPVERIMKTVEKEMRASLAMADDRTNVELALALALWECNALDATRLARVRAIVKSGEDIAAVTLLDADKIFVAKRKRALTALVKKLGKVPAHARARCGKPKASPSSTEFRAGTCFALEHDGRYSAFWIASQYAGRDGGDLGIVCLDLEAATLPTLQDCERAYALRIKPGAGGTWNGDQVLLDYERSTKDQFFAAMAACCVVIGKTRALKSKRMLWGSSSWGRPPTNARQLREKLLKVREGALEPKSARKHRLGDVLDHLMGRTR